MTPKERPGEVTFKGTPDTVLGPDVGPGDPAPGFRAVDNDLSGCVFEPRGGTINVLSAVPSLDTPVCDRQARTLDGNPSEAPVLRLMPLSMDLPSPGHDGSRLPTRPGCSGSPTS